MSISKNLLLAIGMLSLLAVLALWMFAPAPLGSRSPAPPMTAMIVIGVLLVVIRVTPDHGEPWRGPSGPPNFYPQQQYQPPAPPTQ